MATIGLFTLFISFCTPDGCKTQALSDWQTIEECQQQVPLYYALAPGDYIMECK